MDERTFSWRQLPGKVNLRDFAAMVTGEVGMLAASARIAVQALPRLPFGPFIFLGAMLMVLFRLVLLLLVVIVFGSAILVISAARGIAGLLRRGGTGKSRGDL
jgi:prepilin signal peptidase PulO-like enzyme (type II secretory pathway)